MATNRHSIDPDTIEVGQEVVFRCPVPGCTHTFRHTWQPASAPTFWGQQHCRKHPRAVVMEIVEVRDRVDDVLLPVGLGTCLAHLLPEPCDTCRAYIAAGL